MSARRARWSGVLVSDHGRTVLLRGTTGTLVAAAPHAATGSGFTAVQYADTTAVLYSDATSVEYDS